MTKKEWEVSCTLLEKLIFYEQVTILKCVMKQFNNDYCGVNADFINVVRDWSIRIYCAEQTLISCS